jgi:ABC-type transport system involved in multi-copper enzyme maturation permease subunit
MSIGTLWFEWLTWLRYTFLELIRKRVIVITLLLTALYFVLYVLFLSIIAKNTPTDNDLLGRSEFALGFLLLGLYSAQMVAAFFVLFSTMATISGEIENGLLLAVLSRPIPRWRIFLGKWIGFAVWNSVYAAVLFWGIVAAVASRLHVPVDGPSLWRGFALFELIPLVLLSLSMLSSSYFPMLGTGIFTALLYSIGWFGGLLERFFNMPGVPVHTGVEKIGLLTSLLMPADAVFRKVTYELIGFGDFPFAAELQRNLGPFGVSDSPSGAFVAYTALYAVGLMVWGAVHFTRRDV